MHVPKQPELTCIEFLSNYLSFETLEKLIKSCKNCYCCTRHSNNKLVDAWGGQKPCPKEHKIYEKTCVCNCRLMSRKYWNAYHLKRNKEEHEESPSISHHFSIFY